MSAAYTSVDPQNSQPSLKFSLLAGRCIRPLWANGSEKIGSTSINTERN